MKSSLFVFILSITYISLLQAQFSTNVELSSYNDDNLFRTPDSTTEDILSDVGVRLGYRLPDSYINIYYDGTFFVYNNLSERNFSVHDIGFSNSKVFGKDDAHTIYMGAEYTIRSNTDTYNYYDYTQVYAYANLRLDLNYLFLKGGYNFRYRDYANVPDLTNYRHFLFLQLNKSFETRTSVILEADFGLKSFAGQQIFTDSTRVTSGNGRRSSSSIQTSSSVSEIPSLSQAVILARVAQSLHDRIGIYVQYRKQISLTDETIYQNTDSYYQDEELFDDPFSYESTSYSSQLTWIMPWVMKLQVGGALVSKSYISEQAYESEIDSVGLAGNRKDDRFYYYLNFSKTFHTNKRWLRTVVFSFNYNIVRNESNSYWYNFENSILGGGLQLKF